jgi:hypothetical protein
VYLPSFAEWQDKEKPIAISHPQIVSIFDSEMEIIDDMYGVIENSPTDSSVFLSLSGGAIAVREPSTSVLGLSGEVRAKKVSNISKSASRSLSKKLGEHLATCVGKINQKEFFTDAENDDISSQIHEILDFRDFWARYVMSNRKILKNGYIIIMKS